MSRHGYSEDGDCDHCGLYQGTADRVLRSRRGQEFLREMKSALETLPVKRLAEGVVVGEEGVCAMGAVAVARGIPREDLTELHELGPERTADTLGISEWLAREIAFENDEGHRTDEDRYTYMLRWTKRHIRPATEPQRGHCGWCCREFQLKRGRVRWHKHAGATCPGARQEPKELPT